MNRLTSDDRKLLSKFRQSTNVESVMDDIKGMNIGKIHPLEDINIMCRDFSNNFSLTQLRTLAILSGMETVNGVDVRVASKEELCSAIIKDYEKIKSLRGQQIPTILQLYVFGSASGNLGLGDDYKDHPSPTHLEFPKNIFEVSCGEKHTAIITEDGELYTIGGIYGKETLDDVNRPILVPFPDRILKVCCSGGHIACVTEKGELYAWGESEQGQVGPSSKKLEKFPRFIPMVERVVDVACGYSHTAIITENGQLFTFGSNSQGQLGLGNRYNTSQPTLVPLADRISMVSCGHTHTALITENGDAYTFGSNSQGQLGLGKDISNQTRPTLIQSSRKIIKVSCGFSHTAIIDEEGSLYTFGDNEKHNLGVEDQSEGKNRYIPTLVPGIKEKIIQVSCGYSHTLVLTSSGKVYGFGANWNGQLGLGGKVGHVYREPRLVNLPFKAINISCSEHHSAVITENLSANISDVNLNRVQQKFVHRADLLGPTPSTDEQTDKYLQDLEEYFSESPIVTKIKDFMERYHTLNFSKQELDWQTIIFIASQLKTNKKVVYLDLSENSIQDAGIINLAHALKYNTTLKTLDLHNTNFGDGGIIALADMLIVNNTLETLILGKYWYSSDEGVSALVKGVRANTTLTNLDLGGDSYDFGGLGVGKIGSTLPLFAQMLEGNTTLQSLNLSGNKISRAEKEDLQALLLAVNQSELRSLNLSWNDLLDEQFVFIFEILKDNTTLQYLNLNINNEIRKLATAAMVEFWKTNTTLKQFHLRNNDFGYILRDPALIAVLKTVNLEVLDISRNEIKDFGAKVLAEIFSENSNFVRQLTLIGNKIGDEGAIALAEALEYSQDLELNLEENNISDKGADALIRANDNCDDCSLSLSNNKISSDYFY